MGTGIYGDPNEYMAGLDFDYSVWNANTRVDLVNVNWDNNYKDVVRFANKDTLNSFIDGKVSAGITVQNMTYVKPGEDIYLGIPYNRVNRYNYLRASNPLMPIAGDMQKDFYYFILDAEFVTPNTTRLRLQLDVWQTYIYDITFGNCYVERGHIGVANTNKFANYGRSYLTVPEGLDIGGEYRHIARRNNVLIRNNFVASSDAIDGDIIVVSTLDVEASGGTVENPVIVSASGSQINGMPSGADFYVFTSIGTFETFMASIANKPWISQGIVSITYMPSVSRYAIAGGDPIDGEKVIQLVTVPKTSTLFSNWRASSEINDKIPSRYQWVKHKFFTYPYMVIEATGWSGNAIILKPEAWNNPDATVQERASYMPPNQRVTIMPRGYNADTGATVDNLWDISDGTLSSFPTEIQDQLRDVGDDTGDYLDIALSISGFPSLPVVNNMAIAYLASNANQLAYQFTSADWTQQRALGMAQGGYDIATGAMQTAMSAAGIAGNADIATTANNNRNLAAQAAMNSANSLISGIGLAGTPGGFGGAAVAGTSDAVANGVNSAFQYSTNEQNLAVRQKQLADNTVNENKQAGLVRDTNKSLADWGAKGDYGNQISGINAKIQDAKMIQPSVSGQFGGESHNIATNKLEFSFRWKLIDDASIRILGEIWLRYGYAIRAFISIPQTLMVMTKFTYWKFSETYIAGATVPEAHKSVIRGILEKGVTVWANANDIGQIDFADNAPLEGISY